MGEGVKKMLIMGRMGMGTVQKKGESYGYAVLNICGPPFITLILRPQKRNCLFPVMVQKK